MVVVVRGGGCDRGKGGRWERSRGRKKKMKKFF
jgi:hypothetical protein